MSNKKTGPEKLNEAEGKSKLEKVDNKTILEDKKWRVTNYEETLMGVEKGRSGKRKK